METKRALDGVDADLAPGNDGGDRGSDARDPGVDAMNACRWRVVLSARCDEHGTRRRLEEMAAHLVPVVEAGQRAVVITVTVLERVAADAEAYALEAIGRALNRTVHILEGATLMVD